MCGDKVGVPVGGLSGKMKIDDGPARPKGFAHRDALAVERSDGRSQIPFPDGRQIRDAVDHGEKGIGAVERRPGPSNDFDSAEARQIEQIVCPIGRSQELVVDADTVDHDQKAAVRVENSARTRPPVACDGAPRVEARHELQELRKRGHAESTNLSACIDRNDGR